MSPPPWTHAQVESLAPDAASLKAGRELASTRRWVSLGQCDIAVWGLCQGSGSNPYQTQVDLSEPAFRCSCPSRKFPCKHGIGLLLLWSQKQSDFSAGDPPAWVADWLRSRSARAEKQAERSVQRESVDSAVVDTAAQAKRAEQRSQRVESGLAYLETWMHDMVRSGLGTCLGRPDGYWNTAAARMIDCQAPGLARAVRGMESAAVGDDRHDSLLAQLGSLQLLLAAARRQDQLPPPVRADLRTRIGWTESQEELLANAPPDARIVDTWLVAGREDEEEERLRVRRTWLVGGRSGQWVRVMSFAAVGQTLDASLVPGSGFQGEVVTFNGAQPARALVSRREDTLPGMPAPDGRTIEQFLAEYAAALGGNPWLERYPALLGQVLLVEQDGDWFLRDSSGTALPLCHGLRITWHLLALSGGVPITLFGEWDGHRLRPLTAWTTGACHPVESLGAMAR